jgi:hypothetical protein
MSKPHNATTFVDSVQQRTTPAERAYDNLQEVDHLGRAYQRSANSSAAQYRTLTGQAQPEAEEPEGAELLVDSDTPDDSWLKADIVDWLNEHEGVEANTGMTKADLLAMVEQVLTTE